MVVYSRNRQGIAILKRITDVVTDTQLCWRLRFILIRRRVEFTDGFSFQLSGICYARDSYYESNVGFHSLSRDILFDALDFKLLDLDLGHWDRQVELSSRLGLNIATDTDV